MVWCKPFQFAIYKLEAWILSRNRDSWESKWRMNRDEKALKRPSKTWFFLGRIWTFKSQYSSHRISRYFSFICRRLEPSNLCRMLLILHCKGGYECKQSKQTFDKLRASFVWIREGKDFMAFLAILWDRETHVWGIWGFIVLKKIEYGNQFFHYKTTNNIIREVKDLSNFILRLLKLD